MKDGEIEVRQLFELEDFGPSEAIERFRKMGREEEVGAARLPASCLFWATQMSILGSANRLSSRNNSSTRKRKEIK